MNRATKKKLMVLGIVLTFTLSSIAFVVTGVTGSITQQQFKPLQGFVLEGDVDPYVESVYIQNGYTFLKYYYSSQAPEYVNTLPETFTTKTGEVQLIVVKTRSPEDFATISNINTNREIKNVTQESIISALCDSLLVTPVECTFIALQNQPNLTV